ncbi:MAG: hypothetical protein GY710_22065 [Desulfobacteraceae bacterium]|nr:hypothetical protein [Desulfobacteraceae bacterium]
MTSNIFHQLSEIYMTMDREWEMTASQYGFRCKGCEDNCCKSLFFHHTFIEKAFLLHGFKQLPPNTQEEALSRAGTYYNKTFTGKTARSLKLICPLNQDGQCLAYDYRPMICRLHGLPHELHRPGAATFKGPGCHAGLFDKHKYIPFDRTPFYKKMAQVERLFRQQIRKTEKIKETVAQMLLF